MKFEPNKPFKLPPILNGLQRKKTYDGTVSFAEVAKRRAKNKAARKARQQHRG